MRKEERHRVKRDELVNVFERSTIFLEENLRLVSLIAGGAALVLLAGFGIVSWQRGREERASFLLGQLIQTYRAPLAFSEEAQQAPPGLATYASTEERDGKVIEKADDILARYRNSKAAPRALYYKALAQASLKQYDQAAKTLDEFLRRYSGDFLAPMARYDLARVREAQGNAGEALIHFQALAEDPRGLFPREEGLMGVARCQEALGKKDEAKKTYEKIMSDFPGSEYAGEARSRVGDLS
jgi:TolA-binding protein